MYARILIPTDGSPCAELALEQGLALAATLGSDVEIIHVVEEPLPLHTDRFAYPTGLRTVLRNAGEEILDRAAARAKAQSVPARVELIERGNAAQSILQAAQGVDLIVIGTHGRRGFDRLVFGSVAESVLRRSPVPCLVIRGSELEAS